jgi:membrane protease YdiL (CAAX protease family)
MPVALFTSALWLVAHLGEGILRPVYLLPVAVVLATARHFSQSIRAPIALHIIYNLTMVTLPLLPKQA